MVLAVMHNFFHSIKTIVDNSFIFTAVLAVICTYTFYHSFDVIKGHMQVSLLDRYQSFHLIPQKKLTNQVT